MRKIFNRNDRDKEDGQPDLTRTIDYLTATSSEDWAALLDVCERASATEANAKEAAEALRREFKYRDAPQQLSAARLWAIMLQNSSELFVNQCAKNKFLDTLYDVFSSQRTSPVVRERLLDVLAAAAYASPGAQQKNETGFRLLWRKVKPAGKPDEGVPFHNDDPMFNPPIPPSPIPQQFFRALRENIPPQTSDFREEVGTPRYAEFAYALRDIPEEKCHYAVCLFQCLAAAIRPLSLEELADISAELDLNADSHEDALLSACPSLITRGRDRDDITIVQFSHKSVKNFLTSSLLRTSHFENISRYYFSLKAAHATLARVCISVLLRFDETADNTRLKESSPLALYAAQYWVQHIRRGNAATENQGVMERLFDPSKSHLDAWIWMYDVDKGQSRTMENLADRPSRRIATPLYYAALCGFTGLVKHLASLRPKDLYDSHGYYGTPLHAASYMGHYDVALALLDRDPMMMDQKVDNKTPLQAAYYGGQLEIIQLLLDKGAEVDNILNNPYRRNDERRSNAPLLLGDDSHNAILGSSSRLDAIERPRSPYRGDDSDDSSSLDSRIWARGSSSSLETIGPPTKHAVYDGEYPSSITLPSNGGRCNMSFMTSPSDGTSVIEAITSHLHRHSSLLSRFDPFPLSLDEDD